MVILLVWKPEAASADQIEKGGIPPAHAKEDERPVHVFVAPHENAVHISASDAGTPGINMAHR